MIFTGIVSVLFILGFVLMFKGKHPDKPLISALLILNLVVGILGSMGAIYEVNPLTVPMTIFYLGGWAFAYWYAVQEERNQFFSFSFGFWFINFLFFLVLCALMVLKIDTPTFFFLPAIWSLGPLVGFAYFIENQMVLMGLGLVGIGSFLIYTYRLVQAEAHSRKKLKYFSILIIIIAMVGFGNSVYQDSLSLELRFNNYGTMQFEVLKVDDLRVIGTENRETGESYILWLETNEWGRWKIKSAMPTTNHELTGIQKLFALSHPSGEFYEVYIIEDELFDEMYIDGYQELSGNNRVIALESYFNFLVFHYNKMPTDEELKENLDTIFGSHRQEIDDSLLKAN